MIEYCSSVTNSTNKNKQFFLSDFAQLCSCVLSHPLYLSYFLFFSPYLLKLLAFLSPLFFTTTLLLLSILHDNFSSLLENLQTRFEGFEEEDERRELEGFEEFEVYKIVFGSSTIDPHAEFSSFGRSEENPVELSREIEGESCEATTIGIMEQNPNEEKEEKVLGVLISEEKENPVEISGEIEGKFFGIPITDQVGESPSKEELEEEKILGVLISDEWGFPAKGQDDERFDDEQLTQETPECEKLKKEPQMADKKCGQVLLKGANCKALALELTPSSINGGNQAQQRRVIKTHSRRRGESVWDTNDGFSTSKKKHYDDDDDEDDHFFYSSSSSPQSQPISPSLSNLGSMRKEKEWRRTLACKLFEERHNVGGCGGGGGGGGGGGVGEGMDLLWEAYEKTEENRGKQGSKKEKKKKCVVENGDLDDEDEDDEEEGDNGQLCCLQALKFSAVKMNFGMGKPGFMKISKAFKGIGGGWLSQSHHRRRQSTGGGSKKGKN